MLALLFALNVFANPPNFQIVQEQVFVPLCYQCHHTGSLNPTTGAPMLDLSDYAQVLTVVVPGDYKHSKLFKLIDNSLMPPDPSDGVVSAAQEQVVIDWITAGAKLTYGQSYNQFPIEIQQMLPVDGSLDDYDNDVRLHIIVPGDAHASTLIASINFKRDFLAQGWLTDQQTEVIDSWIDSLHAHTALTWDECQARLIAVGCALDDMNCYEDVCQL